MWTITLVVEGKRTSVRLERLPDPGTNLMVGNTSHTIRALVVLSELPGDRRATVYVA